MKNIYQLLKMNNKEMLEYMNTLNANVTDNENYWYFENTMQPECIFVAHIDKVTDTKCHIQQTGDIVTNKSGVLGADDRAGVFSLLELKSKHLNCNFLFTNYEESGGKGVKKFISEEIELLDLSKCKIFIELDRRGFMEYVTYNRLDDSVHSFINQFIPNEKYGSYSDIYDLSNATNIPSVNIGIGYGNEHTEIEYLNLSHMYATIDIVSNIIDNLSDLEKTEIKDEEIYPSYYDSNNDFNDIYSGCNDFLDDTIHSIIDNNFIQHSFNDVLSFIDMLSYDREFESYIVKKFANYLGGKL